MKTLKSVAFGIAFFIAGTINAQVAVTLNIGSPPMWGPAGYTDVQYYYLPDVEAYYDVPSSMFIYQSGGVWVHRTYLPTRYRNYDLYNGYKVVMTDYRGRTPYVYYKEHKIKYAKGYHGPAQKNIGVKPGKKSPPQRVHQQNRSINPRNRENGEKSRPGNENNSKKGNSHGGGHGKKK